MDRVLHKRTPVSQEEQVRELVQEGDLVDLYVRSGSCVLPRSTKPVHPGESGFEIILESEINHSEYIRGLERMAALGKGWWRELSSDVKPPEGQEDQYVGATVERAISPDIVTGYVAGFSDDAVYLLRGLCLMDATDPEVVTGPKNKNFGRRDCVRYNCISDVIIHCPRKLQPGLRQAVYREAMETPEGREFYSHELFGKTISLVKLSDTEFGLMIRDKSPSSG